MLYIANDAILNCKKLLLPAKLAASEAVESAMLSRRGVPFHMYENRDIFYKDDVYIPFKNTEFNPATVQYHEL